MRLWRPCAAVPPNIDALSSSCCLRRRVCCDFHYASIGQRICSSSEYRRGNHFQQCTPSVGVLHEEGGLMICLSRLCFRSVKGLHDARVKRRGEWICPTSSLSKTPQDVRSILISRKASQGAPVAQRGAHLPLRNKIFFPLMKSCWSERGELHSCRTFANAAAGSAHER